MKIKKTQHLYSPMSKGIIKQTHTSSEYNLSHTFNYEGHQPHLKMGMLRLLPEAMYGALMLWQKRTKVSSR